MAVKTHYILCSCRNMHSPSASLIRRLGLQGAIQDTSEPCYEKTQYMSSLQSGVTHAIKNGSLVEERSHWHFFN